MSALSGMKEICRYTARSESSVLIFIRDCDFPATKLGGVWESDTELIDTWRLDQIRASGKKRAKRTRAAVAK